MGNPSDGFNGKTIAMTISNFWAEVVLVESQTLVTPHTFVNISDASLLLCCNVICVSLILSGFSPSSSQ